MAKNFKRLKHSIWWGCGAASTLIHCWWKFKRLHAPHKTVSWFFYKVKIYTYHMAQKFVCQLLTKRKKIITSTQKSSTRICRVASFIRVKKCKRLNRWVDKQIVAYLFNGILFLSHNSNISNNMRIYQ